MPLSTGVSASASAPPAEEEPVKVVRPEPKAHVVTPSGIEIDYFEKPRRYYEIRRKADDIAEAFPETHGWTEAVSVTTALKCLNKEGLSWWGMRVGARAAVVLWDLGVLTFTQDKQLAINVAGTWQLATEDNIYDAIKTHKLSVKDTLEDAGDRGTGVHDALEAWATLKMPVDPIKFPVAERMYAEALRKFTEAMGDAWVTDGVEVQVGSYENGFAGRYDVRGHVIEAVTIVNDALTKDGQPRKRGAKTIVIPEGTKILLDAKTTKYVYDSHFYQLEAYEGASIECGLPTTDMRAVLHLSMHGLYQFVPSTATYHDFLSILDTYRVTQRVQATL